MKSVLEQLYYGKIFPAEEYKPILREVRKKRKAAERHVEDFLHTLSSEQRFKVERLLTEYATMLDSELAQIFSDGFRLGSRMMCEVFMQQEVEGLLEEEENEGED